MTTAIELAYQSLDEDERDEVDDVSNELIAGFRKHADRHGRSNHSFGPVRARELLAKMAVFLEHKQSMRKVAYNDIRAEQGM
jgi:hypothetical protein